MNASDMGVVARLADHYERLGVESQGYDALEVAEHDVRRVKRDVPELWQRLNDDPGLSSREIGDLLYDFNEQWEKSGMSFKNFAGDFMDDPGRVERLVKRTKISRSR